MISKSAYFDYNPITAEALYQPLLGACFGTLAMFRGILLGIGVILPGAIVMLGGFIVMLLFAMMSVVVACAAFIASIGGLLAG